MTSTPASTATWKSWPVSTCANTRRPAAWARSTMRGTSAGIKPLQAEERGIVAAALEFLRESQYDLDDVRPQPDDARPEAFQIGFVVDHEIALPRQRLAREARIGAVFQQEFSHPDRMTAGGGQRTVGEDDVHARRRL